MVLKVLADSDQNWIFKGCTVQGILLKMAR